MHCIYLAMIWHFNDIPCNGILSTMIPHSVMIQQTVSQVVDTVLHVHTCVCVIQIYGISYTE